jgi:hypothetical protein
MRDVACGCANSAASWGQAVFVDHHRVRQPPPAPRRLHRKSEQEVGYSGAQPVVVAGRTPAPLRLLVHDRDSKFAGGFDGVFRSGGLETVRTQFRAPKANAGAERFARTVCAECLDWLLIVARRQLEHVLRVFIDHYNSHRPHRALGLAPPAKERRPLHVARSDQGKGIRRRDRLGGLSIPRSGAARGRRCARRSRTSWIRRSGCRPRGLRSGCSRGRTRGPACRS